MPRIGVGQLRQRLIDNLPYRYRAKLVNWCLQMSTYQARRRLTPSNPIEVLIDNSVLGHGYTHETIGVVQKVNWPPGGEPGEATVIYRAPRECSGGIYDNLQYLLGIIYLERRGYLKWKTSLELLIERNHQPLGRFMGNRTWFSYWLFDGIQIDSVDRHVSANRFDIRENQRMRISQSKDPLYVGLMKFLPKKGNLDAWHIRTAEKHGLFCFLTMDFKLRRNIEQNISKEPIASLHTKIMTPKEFGKYLGVLPLNPYICELSEHDGAKSSARLREELRAG